MPISATPILCAVEIGFIVALAGRLAQSREHRQAAIAVMFLAGWIAVYAVVTSDLGAGGVYVDPDIIRLYPGFWLQLITVAAIVGPVLIFPRVREGLRLIVDRTPLEWFAWFHALRIGALGTAYKAWIGEFPVYFELLVGVPDLLFGLSAVWVALRARRGKIRRQWFMKWNLAGALIIVPSAPILLQLGLPGPLQVFPALPDARAVFTYPMSIAPMIGVPLFVLINLWVAWRLWETRDSQASRQGGRPSHAPESV